MLRAAIPESQLKTGRRPVRLVFALLALVVTGFPVLCTRTLIDMRRDAWEIAREGRENLAATIDADISRNFEVYDLSLRAVASNLMLPEVRAISQSLRQLVLFDRAAAAEYFGAIKVLDRFGNVTIDSSTQDPDAENDADADYFRAHLGANDAGLFVSGPVTDKRGVYAIRLSRRISEADGSFAGVVVGSIKIQYFHDLFRKINLDPDDSITLMNRAGVIIMRIPFDIESIGRDVSQAPGIREVLSSPSGWREDYAAIDHIKRLYVWQASNSPLVVVPGRSVDHIYAAWYSEAVTIALGVAVLIAMTLGVSIALASEMQKRAALQAHLAGLATTDGLTGLANRRRFDRVIELEWQRASRQRTPLALLMIDADNFKSFNDRFGHQEGDRVLRGIAARISESVRRSTDCAARYGGEEFAVILPGLSEENAQVVAENIRKAVEAASDRPAKITVSIGVSWTRPTAGGSYEDLICGADAALYVAKAGGRNRTVVSEKIALQLAS